MQNLKITYCLKNVSSKELHHTTSKFNPNWANCLDEFMMNRTNQYSCPGFMFVPQKPHPFGNKWHSIFCGFSGIMYAVELIEGKDKLPQTSKEYEEKGKSVGLLVCLTKQLWSTGKIVVLDYGFCVLQGIS
jgi:Transposase IS4